MIRVYDLYLNLTVLFLTLVFAFPRVLQGPKFILILILFFLGATIGRRIDKRLILSIAFYVIIYSIPLLNGMISGNEINLVIDHLKLHVIFPVLILLSIRSIKDQDFMRILRQTSYYSAVIVLITTLSSVLFKLNILPFNLHTLLYPEEANLRLSGGFIHIINSNLSYLLFTIPLILIDKKVYSISSKLIHQFKYLGLLSISFLSGRRILMLPFLIITSIKPKKYFLLITTLLISLILLGKKIDKNVVDFRTISERFSSAINSKGDSYIRSEQATKFIDYIKEKPLMGYGLGSYMKDFVRNSKFPTAYERTFHYYLFSFGVWSSILILIYYLIVSLQTFNNTSLKKFDRLSIIIGSFTLFIASYTNPYWMSNFDYCLPLAILIKFSTSKNRK